MKFLHESITCSSFFNNLSILVRSQSKYKHSYNYLSVSGLYLANTEFKKSQGVATLLAPLRTFGGALGKISIDYII